MKVLSLFDEISYEWNDLLSDCCNKKIKKSHGYIWEYESKAGDSNVKD